MVNLINVIEADSNNLNGISVQIPTRAVTGVVGVSGSGKTSLLHHTLGAEGDRRNRIFLGLRSPEGELAQPNAFVDQMPPMVRVGQHSFRASTRTTVGTATGALASIRRLYLACSTPYADDIGQEVPPPSIDSYTNWLGTHYRGLARIWAAPALFQETDGLKEAEHLRQVGLTTAIVRSATDSPAQYARGRRVPTRSFPRLNPSFRHVIEALVGEIAVTGATSGLRQFVEMGFGGGGGRIVVELPDATAPILQSEFGPRLVSDSHWVHPLSPNVYFPPAESLVSFNNPGQVGSGACPDCSGTGQAEAVIESRLVVHPDRSMHDGAFSLWTAKNYKYVNIQHETIEGLRGLDGFDPDVPWRRLPVSARNVVLDGWSEPVTDRERGTGKKTSSPRKFEGFRKAILGRIHKKSRISSALAAYVDEGPCLTCSGTRWSLQARALRVGGKGIHELLALPIAELGELSAANSPWHEKFPTRGKRIAAVIHERSSSLSQVGLGHISGDRGMLDISDGESRRTRLAAALNAREEGLLFLLDEPGRALHEQDLSGLARSIQTLGQSHTVVINEHRQSLLTIADQIIELGPGAGPEGGMLTFVGPPTKYPDVDQPPKRNPTKVGRQTPRISIKKASLHTLHNINCEIPVGRLTCIVGVSGSGKSTFARGILVPAIAGEIDCDLSGDDFHVRPGGHWASIRGASSVTNLVALDHRSPPPNRRSLVGTYTGVFDDVRRLFAQKKPALELGLKERDFSINSGTGRCSTCLGIAMISEDDNLIPCPACGGRRYGQRVLSVIANEMNIVEILDLPVSGLLPHAPSLERHSRLFAAMDDLGIGHISLGRRVDSLSGGEVQRLRIAQRLAREKGGGDLFVLDEPAAGLHPKDVGKLLSALDRIVAEERNSVVLIEHNLALVASSDWVIEFGPGAGPQGGKIIFSGTVAELRKQKTPTALALAQTRETGTITRPPKPAPKKRKPPTSEEAGRAVTAIRHIRGEDVAPAERADGESRDRPAVVAKPSSWVDRRVVEVADLDVEIVRLALDIFRDRFQDEFCDLAKNWRKGGGMLATNPLLPEIRIWGLQIPKLACNAALERMKSAGLSLIRETAGAEAARLRASGPRLTKAPDTQEKAEKLVKEALIVGGGYVELLDEKKRMMFSAGDRLIDLGKGVVGPATSNPIHFTRRSRLGSCPVCGGAGAVSVTPMDLLISSTGASPVDEHFLTKDALDLLRGIRRSDLLPFVKKMSEEGLWPDRTTPFEALSKTNRDILLFGCWARPSHGTFLRAKQDPSEVGSWIRWDGLYRTIFSELHRSKNKVWRAKVEYSATRDICGACFGSGLNPIAHSLAVADKCWADWVGGKHALGELAQSLKGLDLQRQRQRKRRDRIVRCLEAAAGADRHAKVGDTANDRSGRAVLASAVSEFSSMACIEP